MNQTTKLITAISAILLIGCGITSELDQSTVEITVNSDVIYPKFRKWATPSAGMEADFNSPSFQWPSKKGDKYSIRLSSASDFGEDVILKEGIPFAIFNPHKKLDSGTWYWQHKVNDGSWSKTDSFKISNSTKIFETPEVAEFINNISSSHPRVLAKNEELQELRLRSKDYKETATIIEEAEKYINEPAPKEKSALPSFKGKNEFENSKIASLASKTVGWNVFTGLKSLSQAYILTGDNKYFATSIKWMLDVSKWDPKGPTHVNNFGDSGIMAGLAIALDTYWDKLTAGEREIIIEQISARANGFYKLWINKVESRSSSMHVWQHILHLMLQTSLALAGETDDATLWIEYIYELWIAQSPKMGEQDGAWFNGTGYFRMNTLTMYDVNDIFSDLTGVDFMWSDWYKNNPKWLLYSFPPNSVADGFCNDGDKYEMPNINYAGYADAAARGFNDPYAALYSTLCAESLGMELADDDEWEWYRIHRGYKEPLPKGLKETEIPQAAIFPDVGVAYMHTTLPKIETNLMLSVRSSPFGPMGHTHAEQNGFNIAYGGKRLFYNSGYRPSMGDPHFLAWYKHTRGHNAILIDGEGQPFDAGAYGWIPRFIHGEQISYAVGDASNAYSGSDMGKSIDFGMKRFRRHYIMIRPSIMVIYDELEADHDAEWSWLIHNDNGLEVDSVKGTIVAGNELANAQVSLFSSSEIDFRVTDEFSVPAENWTKKRDKDGNLKVFKNQWHFKGVTKDKVQKMRYLAIIQAKPKSGKSVCEEVKYDEQSDIYSVGEWKIKAEMDSGKPAKIEVFDNAGTACLSSSGILKLDGKKYDGKVEGSSKLAEKINGEVLFKEVVDEIPTSIKKAMMQENQE